MKHHSRLNILRLPSQMITVVSLIALVLVGGLAALNAGRSDSLFLLLAFGLLIISLRRMVTWADDELSRYKLTPAQGEFVLLQQRIDTISIRIGLPRSPSLLIAPDDYDIRVFGSWRHWYIAMDRQRAQRLQELAVDPEQAQMIDAALMHELFHFRHNDNIWLEYTRALLRNGLALILWFGLLIIGMVWLASLARQSFFTNYSPDQIGAIFEQLLPGQGNELAHTLFGSQAEFEQLREQALATNFAQALWNIWSNIFPFLLFGSILLLAFWRQFLRLREIYADAGAVQTLGEIESLIKIVTFAGLTVDSPSHRFDTSLRRLWRRLRIRYFSSGLDLVDRINYLHHPDQLYGSAWRYGWLIGLFVNFLNLELFNTAAIMIIGDWPLHIPAVAGVILIALYLLPSLSMGPDTPVIRDIVVMIGLIAGIYGAFVILVLAMLIFWALVNPAFVILAFELVTRTATWYSGYDATPVISDPWTIIAIAAPVNLLQIPTIVLAIALPVATLIALIRRMLTWYGLPDADQRLMPAIVLLILLMTTLLAFVVLPPLTDLALLLRRGMISFASPWYWAVALLTLVVCGAFAAWFVIQDQRYAGRCPKCKEHIPGPFALGKRCPKCQQPLHDWLEAHYSVEAQQ